MALAISEPSRKRAWARMPTPSASKSNATMPSVTCDTTSAPRSRSAGVVLGSVAARIAAAASANTDSPAHEHASAARMMARPRSPACAASAAPMPPLGS
jgi:hypothetical protein